MTNGQTARVRLSALRLRGLCVSSVPAERYSSWCGENGKTKAAPPHWLRQQLLLELLPVIVEDSNALERSCSIAYMAERLCPQAIERQVRALITVSHCFHSLLFPIWPPRDGISLLAHICSYIQALIQSRMSGSCPVQHVKSYFLFFCALTTNLWACFSKCCCLSYMAAFIRFE